MSIDYAKWVRDALDADPNLSRAGLSRHLGHGGDRSRVSRMLDGTRRIRADEIPEIAAYLGVPPPGMGADTPAPTRPVPVDGTITGHQWSEKSGRKLMRAAPAIPPRLDARYPQHQQVAFEMADDCERASLLGGDYVIGMSPRDLRREPQPGDLVVTRRERAGLEQFALARAVAQGARTDLTLLTSGSGDPGKPVAIVIAIYRMV